jgi:hypothetical protein
MFKELKIDLKKIRTLTNQEINHEIKDVKQAIRLLNLNNLNDSGGK